MVDIIIYQGQHIVWIALAVAIDAGRSVGRVVRCPFARQQDDKQYGSSRSGRYRNTPGNPDSKPLGSTVFRSPEQSILAVYLFNQFVGIHISFILRSFSLMRPMRVVTLVWLMPIRRLISSVEKPSR